MMGCDVISQDETFLNQIDTQVEEVKRDLAFRLLVETDEPQYREVNKISSVAGVETQKTDEEQYTPPTRIMISPVQYQEP